jgi:hypothetical protein
MYLIADVARRVCRCLIEPLRKLLETGQGSSEPIEEITFDRSQILGVLQIDHPRDFLFDSIHQLSVVICADIACGRCLFVITGRIPTGV